MRRLLLILAAVALLLGVMPLSASGSSGSSGSDDDRSGSSEESEDDDGRDDDDDDGRDDDDDDGRDDDDDGRDEDDDDDDDDDDGHQRRRRNRNRNGGGDDDGGGTATPGTGGTPTGPAPNAATVQLLDKTFNPATVRVAVGGKVTWNNGSGREHTVTGNGFDSGVMSSGQFSHTFASPGTVQYRCLIHSGMNGTVVVGDGAGGPNAAASSSATRSSASSAPSSGASVAGSSGGSSGLPSMSAPVQPPIAAAAADSASVEVRDFAFAPPNVTVAAGGSVTWTLVGQAPHTVTGDGFDSGTLEAGDTYSETFDQPGTVDYRCNFHPEMTGTVTVVAASGGAAAGGDDGGAAGGAADDGADDTADSGGSGTAGSVLANSGVPAVPLLVAAFALLLAGGTLVVRRVRRTA